MRHILTLSAAFLLAGCAVPPAVTIASLAFDGLSYATTGKSTTDHALSAFASEDCALMRILQEKAVCSPEEVQVGMAETSATAGSEGKIDATAAAEGEFQQNPFRDQDY